MPSIVIRIRPGDLTEPDLDIRYKIPDLLKERSKGLLIDNGYDFETKTDAIQIFLGISNLAQGLQHVIELLENERLFGNDLSKAAQVGISDTDAADTVQFRIVYPEGVTGIIEPNP